MDLKSPSSPFPTVMFRGCQSAPSNGYAMLCSVYVEHGDLSATPEGSPVDYDSTELADNSIYFYKPLGKIFCCILYKIIVH